MIKKTVKYNDYNGIERTEDHYFHLNEAEVMELEMSINGGLSTMIDRVIAAQDGATIMKVFKDIILRAYGVKSDDGRRFIKNQEVRDSFVQTEAYSIIFMELVTDAKKAAEFVNGIIPEKQGSSEQ